MRYLRFVLLSVLVFAALLFGSVLHHAEAKPSEQLDLGDSDGDGVPNFMDACPTMPGPAPVGCPFPGGPTDSDGDGVPDIVDLCPTEPGSPPVGCPLTDGDGDTVLDLMDVCPTTPGPAPLGCPLTDSDGDTVLDFEDLCPTRPGHPPYGCSDSDGDIVPDFADLCPAIPGLAPTGCPASTDSDGDGIPDEIDLCPTVPGPSPIGCTDPTMDTDGDALTDRADLCPAVAGPLPAGCPDSDGDGILDVLDQCPGHDDNQDADGNGTPDGCDIPYDSEDSDNQSSAMPARPGPDMVYIPPDAVMGTFTADTPLYFAPTEDALTGRSMRAGQSLWVYGLDASGQFYQVLLSGRLYWVPASQVGPTYSAPWNGHPLPSSVAG